ncbi:MCE family protein [Gordonia aichiensis]|nr:MCE family protein [Gordonia aichiensis]
MCAACSFSGVNSVPLPGNTSDGDTYRVEVELANAQNMVGNSPVKVDNVTVGNIRSITVDGWHAKLVLELDKDKNIPANVNAALAQTSLFGSQYIELSVPKGQEPKGQLHDGMRIALKDTSQYPAVEEVLSSLSLVLNGSGLQQLRTITSELDRVMTGHEDSSRSLIRRLNTLVSGLSDQRRDIQNAVDGLAKLSGELKKQQSTIAKGIDSISPALAILDTQQDELVRMLDSVGRFGDAATGVLNRSRDDLTSDVSSLKPTLDQLSKSGTNLTEALKIALTVPFPINTTSRAIRGDYMNLFLTLDISADKIAKVVIPSVGRLPNARPQTARSDADPLRAPLDHKQEAHR